MLEKIVAAKRLEIAETKRRQPLSTLLQELRPGNFAFSKAIRQNEWALIAECKLASPVKGCFSSSYTVPELAQIYTTGGAKALSVHTDKHFYGTLEDIARVRAVSQLPILRKDFIIDDYQIYEARMAGADAILLITAILSDRQIKEYLQVAYELGMDSLVEVHTLEELNRIQKTSAELVGINNRDLKSFVTDIKNTLTLLPNCLPNQLVISESGISTGEQAYWLKRSGVRGILVGEGLVKADDIQRRTQELALVE